jgi:predicted phosphoadenosine phosphosulfate sulfurtransferase
MMGYVERMFAQQVARSSLNLHTVDKPEGWSAVTGRIAGGRIRAAFLGLP